MLCLCKVSFIPNKVSEKNSDDSIMIKNSSNGVDKQLKGE